MVLFGARLVQLRRTCALLSTSPVMVPRFSDCARSLSITAHQKAPRDAYGASQLPPHCDMHLLLRRQPRSPLCDHVEGLMPSLSLEPQCLSCSPSDAGAVRCVCARADAHATLAIDVVAAAPLHLRGLAPAYVHGQCVSHALPPTHSHEHVHAPVVHAVQCNAVHAG
jgi:hypothetical protein